MKAVLIACIMAATVLAGCSDGGADPVDTNESEFEDVELQSGKGLIRGVVVTEAVVPIEGATVQLMQTEESLLTDDKGAFQFSNLEPGTYVVQARAPGFESMQSSASVEAGVKNPGAIKIMLPADPAGMPDVVALQWDGFIECSTSYVAVCAVLADVGLSDDEFNHLFELEPGMDHIQTEMMWESNQDLGANMYYTHRYGTKEDFDAGFYSGTFNSTEGPSPLLLVTHGDEATGRGLGDDNQFNIAIFSGEADGTNNPVIGGPGLTLSQRFTIYVHVFYGYTPPTDWRFSETPEPPAPQ